ncbi:hypothetical protein G5B30_04150 [Sphingobacterium sp. SGG-5]|uniref:glycan-binding surface protein n=1 Tax=Sphingobacterium sp. SGG-5 TaxID=2710881 RepID=UPI0013EE11FA|nr:glycan-binding surface protein [Sphingobacterium sp. SGG-5]NGM61107.1 hypothetical protein [Sphingobacterium sp. SGG-5]
MRKLYNIIGLLMLTIVAIVGFQSCEKKELPNDGKPTVRYVSLTDPASSDSLIVAGYQGQLIALVGDNLEETTEIWFNDQQALLTPPYITSQSILVRVPLGVPQEVTNTIRLVFKGGGELEYDFRVVIGAPVLNSMRCEYVADGEVVAIRGSNFYEPLTVVFSGGLEAEIVSVEETILQVRVPVGAEEGPLTVTSNFGETVSNFWLRDSRNIFVKGDVHGWWGAAFKVTTDPGPEDPQKINGTYIRVKQGITSGQWLPIMGGPASAVGADQAKAVPDDAIENPENYNLKFEVNTIKPYSANMFRINVGLYSRIAATDFTDGYDNTNYAWPPPYDTQGEWETIVIPFERVMGSYSRDHSAGGVNPNDWGYNIRLLFSGPGALDCDMAFDNFRVVPKVNED